jgi:nitronate monooxygenase
MLVESGAEDIIYSSLFTGVQGNYLRGSIVRAGFDPDNLAAGDKQAMNFGSGAAPKAWKDIWGAGQSVSGIHHIETVAAVVDRMAIEYREALERLSG